MFDPIKWIDAELEFVDINAKRKAHNMDIENDKIQSSLQQGLMTFEEVKNHLRTTKLALRRRMEI
ncbi:hypothetical protein ACR79L_18365 [Sphingobacterium spiritivorum]|uniref:hypothetical protein n=1 Tax=Sphingobacterium spiritivorum TaxID=258 RepID=UPI003DA4F1F0